jgi:hypothetical protein
MVNKLRICWSEKLLYQLTELNPTSLDPEYEGTTCVFETSEYTRQTTQSVIAGDLLFHDSPCSRRDLEENNAKYLQGRNTRSTWNVKIT